MSNIKVAKIRQLFGTVVSLLGLPGGLPGVPLNMNAANVNEMRRVVGYHLSRLDQRVKSPRAFVLPKTSDIVSWDRTFVDQIIRRGFIKTDYISWIDIWQRHVYKKTHSNIVSRRLNELMRDHATRLQKRHFDAMVQQIKGEDKLVANATTCSPMEVVVYTAPNTINRITTLNTTLPEKQINRKSIINTYEGIKMYPRIKVRHQHVTPEDAGVIASTIGVGKIGSCEYALDMKDSMTSGPFAIVYSRTTAVAACSWVRNIRKKSVHIHFLCSSRVCKGAGTALLYAMEEVAKTLDLNSISVESNGRAKPFYFKVGMEYNSNEAWSLNTGERPSSIKRSRSTNNTTSSSSKNTAQSRLRYPAQTMMPMIKRLRRS